MESTFPQNQTHHNTVIKSALPLKIHLAACADVIGKPIARDFSTHRIEILYHISTRDARPKQKRPGSLPDAQRYFLVVVFFAVVLRVVVLRLVAGLRAAEVFALVAGCFRSALG
ncbi:hypothetical protein LZ22198_MCBDPFMK_02271 [Levilactobacillus zymae]